MATVAVRAENAAFLNLGLDPGAAAHGNEPAEIVRFVGDVVELEDKWVILSADSTWVSAQVIPHQASVALSSCKHAGPALDALIVSTATNGQLRQKPQAFD